MGNYEAQVHDEHERLGKRDRDLQAVGTLDMLISLRLSIDLVSVWYCSPARLRRRRSYSHSLGVAICSSLSVIALAFTIYPTIRSHDPTVIRDLICFFSDHVGTRGETGEID